MARVKVPIVVISSSTGLPVNGASVALSFRGTGGPAPWWPTESGGASSTSAIATDASGRVAAWVDRGAYNATISGTGITTYTESFDAAAASNAAVDQTWVDPTVLLPGEIKMYGGAAAPVGWLVCDGSLVSRTTYASLFSAIGTAYGAGDGSTTFKLPDLKGRSPVGAGAGAGLTARTNGQTGGEESHLLASGEMPSHTHTVSGTTDATGSHTHSTLSGYAAPLIGGDASFSSADWNPPGFNGTWGTLITHLGNPLTITGGPLQAAGNHSHAVSGSAAAAGGGGTHNNMHPFAVVNFIIKT